MTTAPAAAANTGLCTEVLPVTKIGVAVQKIAMKVVEE
jgi:hypothetical protein